MKFQKIAIITLLLFSFSGLIKWIGLPFDTTIVFGLLTLLFTVFYLMIFKFKSLGVFALPFVLFFVFHFLYFITAFYTPSNTYYLDKISRIALNIIAFMAPIVIVKTNKDFLFLKKCGLIFLSIALILVTYNWFSNGLDVFLVEDLDSDQKLPNYMSVSYFLATFLLFFHERKSFFYIFLKIASCLFIILLASKGVLLFLVLIFLLELKRLKIFKKENFKYVFLLLIVSGVYVTFSFQNLFQNISNRIFLGSDFEQDSSSLVRIKLLEDAFNIIPSNPFLGIGIGGFGVTVTNIDERLSPHNIPIEILLETGFIGFSIFCVLVYFFYNAFKKRTINHSNKALYLSYLYPCLLIFLGDLVSGIIEDSRLNYFWLGLAVSFYSYQNRMNAINNKD